MKKYILILALAACSKPELPPPIECDKVCLLSDKYNLGDSLYIRTDTLWKDDNICGETLDSLKAQPERIFCTTAGYLEVWRYVIGDKLTFPKRF